MAGGDCGMMSEVDKRRQCGTLVSRKGNPDVAEETTKVRAYSEQVRCPDDRLRPKSMV